jgi:capsular exopolysaccharide synthesis family protein
VIQANKLDPEPGGFEPGMLQKVPVALTRSARIAAFSDRLKVKLRRGTRLIDISVSHENPKLAQALARSLIEEYGNEMVEGRANPSKQANKFLVDEVERLRSKVMASENALQSYREKNQAVSLEDKQNIVVERLKDLNMRVAKAQNDRVALESDLAQLEKFGRDPDKLLGIGSIANAQSVLDVQRVCTAKEVAFAMIKQRYGSENPAYVQARLELEQVKATLDKAVLNAVDSLRAKYEAARITQDTSEKMLREQTELALDLSRKAIEYNVLTREVESDRALFDSVVKRMKETGIMQNFSQAYLRVVEAPTLPDRPDTRKQMRVVALGLFGGLMLGCWGVIGAQVLRPTFQTLNSAGRALGFPALGAIPRVRALKVAAGKLPGITAPQSPAAEAFRFVATSVLLCRRDADHKILLFASPAARDGRSFCAAGYAVALAQSGVRTLLIDADLRHPMLAQIFSLPAKSGGLAACLSGTSTLEGSVLPTKVENLSILPAGSPSAAPAALFSDPALAELLQAALVQYQQVVIDSAPVNEASETLLLAKEVQAVCLVIQANRTAMTAVSRACQLLDLAGLRPLGFILNRASRR